MEYVSILLSVVCVLILTVIFFRLKAISEDVQILKQGDELKKSFDEVKSVIQGVHDVVDSNSMKIVALLEKIELSNDGLGQGQKNLLFKTSMRRFNDVDNEFISFRWLTSFLLLFFFINGSFSGGYIFGRSTQLYIIFIFLFSLLKIDKNTYYDLIPIEKNIGKKITR